MRALLLLWLMGCGALTLGLSGCLMNPENDDGLPRATPASASASAGNTSPSTASNPTSSEELQRDAAFKKAVESPSSRLVETARPVVDESPAEKNPPVPDPTTVETRPSGPKTATVEGKSGPDSSFNMDNLEVPDASLNGKLVVERVGSSRTGNNLLAVSAGLKNKLGRPLALEVQTVYCDAAQSVLTGTATWIPITLKPHEQMDYHSAALSEDATDFTVRIRRAGGGGKPKTAADLTPWR